MGSGGGGRYIRPTSEDVAQKLESAKERERQRLDEDVNRLLAKLLARFNDRDKELQNLLADAAEIDQVLLGGSVAKHTAVDGLSDIDALVVLNQEEYAAKSPAVMLERFYRTLTRELPRNEVESIEKGQLAATVKYRDGTEIQLLPALRSGQVVSIAAAGGKTWNDTHPRRFQRELTRANSRLNGGLVPAIKLLKSLVASFPQQKQLTGYHVEAMALEAAKNYSGATTPRALLIHILAHAADRVLKPITDKTGQSRTVDSYLGDGNSLERRNISQTLGGVRRRLEAATSVAQWSAMYES